MTLDENLNWNQHIKELSAKLRRANGVLCKLRHYIPYSVLREVYYALFSSHMRYGCQVWGQKNTYITNRIFLLQKCAIRVITSSLPLTPSKQLFGNLKILTVFDLVKLLNVLFVYETFNFNVPVHISTAFKFKKLQHNFNTKGKRIGIPKQVNVNTNTFGIYSVTYRSINCWNFFQKYFSPLDLTSISYTKLKNLVINYYLQEYMS